MDKKPEPNSIPHLQHTHNLDKMVMERLEQDLMETKSQMERVATKHDQVFQDYIKAQARFMQSFAKLTEAKEIRTEFDAVYKNTTDCCISPKKD